MQRPDVGRAAEVRSQPQEVARVLGASGRSRRPGPAAARGRGRVLAQDPGGEVLSVALFLKPVILAEAA